MIPNNKNTFTVDNNLGGDKVKMQISADATVHLMGLLTDLYSDPELACIREYSTNAWDSHIDAGNTDKPIRVTTPSSLDPYLTIQDFGVGMDEETIRNIYSQYGESTKRSQKTTNGSMGIGAKAALGYTNQFTVAGVKNGIKTLVSVSRDEDGAGVMEIVYSGKTDEPSGVTIKIPVKPYNSFKSKAHEFFQFWKSGTVLLDNSDPAEKFEKLTDRIVFTTQRTDVIVMGNVAYPVDMQNYSISGSDGRKVACFVEMNGKDEVTFTPSREGLIYNGVTKSAIVNLRSEYQKTITEHVNNSIKNAKDYHEAFTLSAKFRSSYRWLGTNVKWNGHSIEDFPILDDRITDKNGKAQYAKFLCYNMFTSYRPVSDGHSLNYSSVIKPTYVIITGYPAKKTISAGNKERLKEFVTEVKKLQEFTNSRRYYGASIFLTDMETITNHELFDKKNHLIYKWSEVLSSTREPAPAAPKVAGRYHCWDGARFALREVKEDEKIIFWSPARDSFKPNSDHIRDMHKNFSEYTLVADAANRHEKIKRDFKNSQSWSDFQTKYTAHIIDRDFKKVSDDDFEHYYINSEMSYHDLGLPWNDRNVLKALDRLDDKEYARIARLIYRRPTIPQFALQHDDFENRVQAAKPKSLDTRNFAREYPMVYGNIWAERPDAVIAYMNEMYAKRKGNN